MFKDLFSAESSNYAKYRPNYPKELFESLAEIAPARTLAWDCGTGNGQAALQLTKYFSSVIATDPSAKQISLATPHSKITYEVGIAERSELKSESVDLITVAQAFHWFRHGEFFHEVRRVLKPGGVLAVWCYELANISPEIDATVQKLYKDVLGPFWEPERRHIENRYKDILFELSEIDAPEFKMSAEWSLDQWVGYLKTWSALKKFSEKFPNRNPIEEILPELKNHWGTAKTRKVVWPLSVRMGQKKS